MIGNSVAKITSITRLVYSQHRRKNHKRLRDIALMVGQNDDLAGKMIARTEESFQDFDGAYGPQEPIAIVGVAIRLPGQVSNAQDLWQLMMEKKSGLVDVPKERWNIDGFHSEVPKPGTVQNRQAYYLNHIDLEKFDASCFSFSPQEIERLDPMQRQLLEIARECLDNAGEVNWRNKDIGCYVGQFSGDWLEENAMDPHVSGLYRGSGFADFFLPNRVSYEYGWTGPSMTIKTGCSASMVAVHQAAEALRNRSCSAAVVMSANLMTSPLTTVVYTEAGILSKTGKCKTFDASADGYGRGEAVNAVLVKRLSDAIRDGNPIRAILRGSATNHDGREGKSGMLNPNTLAHEALIRKAYKDAGIDDFSQTAFFECHGTGTPAGDPQEVAAVARVFGESGIVIGALKPNVGHSEGAAGLSSIIKAILALEKSTIPPNIYLKNPNMRIPWKTAKLTVPTDPLPWPQGRAKRISVNSFGVGGSNAHVILESHIGSDETIVPRAAEPSRLRLLLFSAGNDKSLSMQVERHQKYLETNPSSLDDLAYTLGRRREHMPCRTFAMVDENGKFEVSASQARQRAASRTVFVFTGQGAQSPGMGKQLLETNTVFRATIQTLDKHLQSLSDAPSWRLKDELSKLEDSQVMESEFSIPCSTAIQVALVDVLRSLNVHPKAVVGHSSGEIAAAYAAEIVTAKEAIILAFYRGRAVSEKAEHGPGAMAAVGLSPEAVHKFLVPGALVACENSQMNTTISGDKPAVEASLEQIRKEHPDILARLLRVESAFHSHHMKPHGNAYESLIRPHLSNQPSKIPFFSTVTGDFEMDGFGPEYWHQSFVKPVLFHSALRKLVEKHGNNLFVEIGPHPTLQGPINQIMRAYPTVRTEYVATLRRDEDSATSLTRLAGNLFVQQVPFDAAAIIPQGRVLVDLPTYAWLHETTYIDAPRNAYRFKHRKFPRHDLLGARVLEGNDIEPAWRNMLELKDVHWLADHGVQDKTVFPGAGFMAIAGEAIRQVSNGQHDGYTIRDLSISAPLMLTEDRRTEIYTRLIPSSDKEEDRKWYDFKIMSFDGTQWASHCTGLVASAPRLNDETFVHFPQAPLPRKVATDEWYETTKRVGYDWRLAFQGLDDITSGTLRHEATATIYDFDDVSHYAAHPTVLDQCFQISLVAKTRGLRRNCVKLALPTSIDRIDVCGQLKTQMRIYSAAANEEEPDSGAYNAMVIPEEEGRPLISFKGMHFSDVPSAPYDDSLLLSTLGWELDVTFSKKTGESTDPLQSYMRLLGWKYPMLRVLQIGAGDIAVTRAALDALQPSSEERLYSKFVYAMTDHEALDHIDKEITAAKDFKALPMDVANGGLEALSAEGPYDCIILEPEFLTALRRLSLSFEAIRQLLRTHGHLLVHSAYGRGATKRELNESASDLKKSGFEFGSVLSSSSANVSFITGRLSLPSGTDSGVEFLVGKGDSQGLAQSLKQHFIDSGVEVTESNKLGSSAKPTVISLLDLDGTSVFNIDDARFRPFIDSLTQFRGSIIWLLPPCQTNCDDPRAAMMIGLARTIRQEYNADLTVVEIDVATRNSVEFPSIILSLYKSLAARDRFGGALHPDYEYAIVDGVIKIPRFHWHGLSDEASALTRKRPTMEKMFRENSSYLLIGGLGGLGRSVATWMVENGARSLLFLSRSAGDPENDSFAAELESEGCRVQLVSGSVTDTADVRRAIKLAGPGLAGVMQMSMVLRDNSLATMTFSEWEACVKPKVQGTMELHEALSGVALDFFVLFSSGSGISGQHGQANYNAANTFIDAFVHFRHAQGLPAAVVDIGVMDDIGAVARNEQMVDIFRNAGHTFLKEQDLLNGLSIAVASQGPGPFSQLILGVSTDKSLSDPTNRTIWKRDVRMGVAHRFERFSQVDADTGSASQKEHEEILTLAKNNPEKLLQEDTLMAVARSIGLALSNLLVRPIDEFMLADPLDALGLDSVVAIELVSWLQRNFRVGFMTLEIIQCSSLLNLAEQVVRRLVPNAVPAP